MSNSFSGFTDFLGCLFLFFYFLPAIIAFIRKHASRWGILVVNILFGWTLIGWIIALIWSLSNKGANQTIIIHNKNNQNFQERSSSLSKDEPLQK